MDIQKNQFSLINISAKGSMAGALLWSALLCILWFGHFNNWWPSTLPFVFTIIVSVFYGILLIVYLVTAVICLIAKLSDRW